MPGTHFITEVVFQLAKINHLTVLDTDEKEELKTRLTSILEYIPAGIQPEVARDFVNKTQDVNGKKININEASLDLTQSTWESPHDVYSDILNKDIEMAYCLLDKFSDPDLLKGMKLATNATSKDKRTIFIDKENNDAYWGTSYFMDKDGKKNPGKNRYGLMLAALREIFDDATSDQMTADQRLAFLLRKYKNLCNEFKGYDFNTLLRWDGLTIKEVYAALNAQFARKSSKLFPTLLYDADLFTTDVDKNQSAWEACRLKIQQFLGKSLEIYTKNNTNHFYHSRIPIPIDLNGHFGYVVIDLTEKTVVISEPTGNCKFDSATGKYIPTVNTEQTNYCDELNDLKEIIDQACGKDIANFTYLNGPKLISSTEDSARITIGMLQYLTSSSKNLAQILEDAPENNKIFDELGIRQNYSKRNELIKDQIDNFNYIYRFSSSKENYFQFFRNNFRDYNIETVAVIAKYTYCVYFPVIQDLQVVYDAAPKMVKEKFKQLIKDCFTEHRGDVRFFCDSLRNFLPEFAYSYCKGPLNQTATIKQTADDKNYKTDESSIMAQQDANEDVKPNIDHKTQINHEEERQEVEHTKPVNFLEKDKLNNIRQALASRARYTYTIQDPVKTEDGEEVARVVDNSSHDNDICYEIYTHRITTNKREQTVFENMLISFIANSNEQIHIKTLASQSVIDLWIKACHEIFKNNLSKLIKIIINDTQITDFDLHKKLFEQTQLSLEAESQVKAIPSEKPGVQPIQSSSTYKLNNALGKDAEIRPNLEAQPWPQDTNPKSQAIVNENITQPQTLSKNEKKEAEAVRSSSPGL